jgi:hypothetical protein
MLKSIQLLSVFLWTTLLANTVFAAENTSSAFESAIVSTALHRASVATHPLVTIDGPSVRMTLFTPYDGYKTSDKTLGATIWATVEPELQNLCKAQVAKNKKISHEALTIWLTKLLGLPTKDASARRFVIIDVPAIQAHYGSTPSTIGIFRPCTDPRIGTHRDGTPACPKQMDATDPYISSDFKTWFINNSIASFTLDAGMPWTEYGYTYNWNLDARTIDGASEFVVMKNTPITVLANPNNPSTAYISAEQYCGVV